MKHYVKSLTASVLAACTLFSQSALSANAAQDTKAQRLAEVYAEYERLAAEMNVTPFSLNDNDDDVKKVPTQYISYLIMKGNLAYGNVSMEMTHNYNALSYDGTTNGPHGTVSTSYDNLTTFPTYECGATAYYAVPTGSDHTKLIFRQEFTAATLYKTDVQNQVAGTSPLSLFSYPVITSAHVSGHTIPASSYSTYFDNDFHALGDLNNDNYISQADHDLLMHYIAGYDDALTNDYQLVLADIDGNGTVNVIDGVALATMYGHLS